MRRPWLCGVVVSMDGDDTTPEATVASIIVKTLLTCILPLGNVVEKRRIGYLILARRLRPLYILEETALSRPATPPLRVLAQVPSLATKLRPPGAPASFTPVPPH